MLKYKEGNISRVSNRQHSLSLYRGHARSDKRNNYFSNRITQLWNSLPEHVVSAMSINSFKNRLDKFWQHQEAKYDHTTRMTWSEGPTKEPGPYDEPDIEDQPVLRLGTT